MTDIRENNQVTVVGIVAETPMHSHTVYAEQFYIFPLRIARLSDTFDEIKVLISERLFSDAVPLCPGSGVRISGQFRSYNNYTGAGSRLVLTVFAKDIALADADDFKDPNRIFLDGYLCKSPVYRTTPFGREIADVLLAVNRAYNKSDYIPAIAWGRNARFCRDLPVGTHLQLWGRIQSRAYVKHLDEETTVTKTAYEVSISKLEIISDPESHLTST